MYDQLPFQVRLLLRHLRFITKNNNRHAKVDEYISGILLQKMRKKFMIWHSKFAIVSFLRLFPEL